MNERIWVNPNGLRVVGQGEPGGHWEDDEAQDLYDDGDEGFPCPAAIDYAELGAYIQQRLERERSTPWSVFFTSLWEGAKRVVRPVPYVTVWAGMIATFFWNSYRSLPIEYFDWLEAPEDFPVRAVAAVGETAVFVVWTLCFRHTIRAAVREEFSGK